MKLLILIALMFSALSFANTEETSTEKNILWPRLMVWPNGVDLQINNHTEDDYRCSGTIYINHESRRLSTEYYFNTIYAHRFENRHFFNRYYNDRIVSAHHNVYCYKQ